MRLFIHGGAATPTPLIEALAARTDLDSMRAYHLHLEGAVPIADPACAPHVRCVSLFTGASLRPAVEEGRADFVPVFLSDIPRLFSSGRIPLDAALVQVSPPDKHGYCSLGTSVDAARAAVDSAKLVIAEINDQMPRTHGNTAIPLARFDATIRTSRPLHAHTPADPDPVTDRIGELVAALVEDGSTLQMGIGAIPDAVLARLGNKRELGIHTEMFSDGVVPLVEGGVITNRRKGVRVGRTLTSFVIGTTRLFDFIDDNPLVHFAPCDYTNDTAVIARNDRVVAINSALQIDLTGQVCADSIGHRIYSGIGGQMDFIRGAARSRDGKPVIALPSTARNGSLSRIVPELSPGAGVVTTRGHVHWVVTEHGAVNLHGLTLRERAEALVSISHPDFRAELRNAANRLRHFQLG
jgi:acyl-CoA hydrolase